MNDKLLKLKTQADINRALKEYRGESYVEPPTKTICHDSYDELTRHQIDQGVIALAHACNLSGGSIDDVDLYKLVRTYLLDHGARAKINAVVQQS
jgi:hypothetical protein